MPTLNIDGLGPTQQPPSPASSLFGPKSRRLSLIHFVRSLWQPFATESLSSLMGRMDARESGDYYAIRHAVRQQLSQGGLSVDDEGYTPEWTMDFDEVDDDEGFLPPGEPPEDPPGVTIDSLSEQYINVSRLAEAGCYAKIQGREKEVRMVLQALLGGVDRRNAVLLGEDNEDKLDTVKQLANTMANGQVPDELKQRTLIQCDLKEILNEWNHEKAFKDYVDQCFELKDEVICVIPQLEELRSYRFAGELRYLQEKMDAGLKVIGTLHGSKSAHILDSTSAGVSRVFVKEMRRDRILNSLRERYEETLERFDIVVLDDALARAADLAVEEQNRRQVDTKLAVRRASEFLDLAIGELRLRQAEGAEGTGSPAELDGALVRDVVSQADESAVSVGGFNNLDLRDPDSLSNWLKGKVFGQDHAIDNVADAVIRCQAGLKDPDSPMGTFLFLGPTGVGKTELAKRLAEKLYGDKNNLVRIDMSEYQQEHTVARLVGAPPGYVGYDEGGQLTEAVKKTPNTVVLLDEVEKAHPDVLKIFLQVFDDGRLTDGQGTTVDFRNVLFILTSNFQSAAIRDMYDDGYTPQEVLEDLEPLLVRYLSPELYNRLEAVPFNGITEETFGKIIPALLKEKAELIQKARKITMTWTPKIQQYLIDHGYSREFGMRPCKRCIERDLIGPLAKAIVARQVREGDTVLFDVDENGAVTVARA